MDELDALALEAAVVVVGLERSLESGVEGHADGGIAAGGSGGVADVDGAVIHALHIDEGGVGPVGASAVRGFAGGRGVAAGGGLRGSVRRAVGQAGAGREGEAERHRKDECQCLFHFKFSFFIKFRARGL